MDAFISKKTIKFLDILFGKNSHYSLTKKNNKIKKKINMHKTYHTFKAKLKQDLKKSKRVCLIYPYKTGKASFYKESIEDIQNICAMYAGCEKNKVKVYHGDIDEETKKELLNPDLFWGDGKKKKGKVEEGDMIHCVIYNSCITVGVNCSLPYDKLYMCVADHVIPRDIIQATFRFRKFKDDFIEMYCFKNVMKDIFNEPSFHKPTLDDIIPPGVDKQLYMAAHPEYFETHRVVMDMVRNEMKNKTLECLKWFFKRTGYEIVKYVEPSKSDVRKAFMKNEKLRLREMNNQNTFLKYDEVPAIDKETFKELKDRLNLGIWAEKPVSQIQKYQIHKYIINEMFINQEDEPKKLYEVKKLLFSRRQIMNGINDILEQKYGISAVIDKDFNLNDKKLTKTQKDLIGELYDLGTNWKQNSDNIIKKKIMEVHFSSDVLKCKQKRVNSVRKSILTFNKTFENLFSVYKLYRKPNGESTEFIEDEIINEKSQQKKNSDDFIKKLIDKRIKENRKIWSQYLSNKNVR